MSNYNRKFPPTHRSALLLLLTLILLTLPPVTGRQTAHAQGDEIPTMRFSPEARVTGSPIQVTLTSLVGGAIRYTTDGNPPNPASPAYSAPLTITQPTVIRARAYDADGLPLGDTYTRTYLVINYPQTIPIMAMTINPGDLNLLHDNPTARGRDWERPMTLEYFEPGGRQAFNVKAGMRIHGGKSREWSVKKSYRLYFRKGYGGPGTINYPFFNDTPVTEFDKLILRAGYNDAFTYADEGFIRTSQTYGAAYIRDQVVRNLHRDMGQPIAHGRWVLLYLNGNFWGLYNLTERLDLQMLQSYSDETADWDIIEKVAGENERNEWIEAEEVRDGDYGAWYENQTWIATTDFSNPGNIGVLEWRVDMENLFSYMFLQAYVQNYDWPRANWLVFRRKDAGASGHQGQWRMAIWDAEYAFGGGSKGFQTDMNTLVKVHSPHDSITRILEKPFIANCALKVRFVDRAKEYLGLENPLGKPADQVGQLSKARVKAEIERQAAIVRPYIQMEADRWVPGTEMGQPLWEHNIQNMLTFAEEREDVMLNHLHLLRYQTFVQCQ